MDLYGIAIPFRQTIPELVTIPVQRETDKIFHVASHEVTGYRSRIPKDQLKLLSLTPEAAWAEYRMRVEREIASLEARLVDLRQRLQAIPL